MNSRPRPSQAYAGYVIIRATELVTRKHMKRSINNRFPLLNNTSLLFAILYSCREVYENIEHRVFPVPTTIEGTKYWTL